MQLIIKKESARNALNFIYWIQTSFIMIMYSGSIYRRELPLWCWGEYAKHIKHPALYSVYSYIFFYSFFFMLPFVICKEIFKKYEQADRIFCSILISAWCLFSFFTYGESLFAFLRAIPWKEKDYAFLLWLAFTIVICTILIPKIESMHPKKDDDDDIFWAL